MKKDFIEEPCVICGKRASRLAMVSGYKEPQPTCIDHIYRNGGLLREVEEEHEYDSYELMMMNRNRLPHWQKKGTQ